MSQESRLDLLSLRCISGVEDIGDTCLPIFKHNVLKFLHIPAVLSEDCEAVSEDADLIQMSDLDLAHLSVTNTS